MTIDFYKKDIIRYAETGKGKYNIAIVKLNTSHCDIKEFKDGNLTGSHCNIPEKVVNQIFDNIKYESKIFDNINYIEKNISEIP